MANEEQLAILKQGVEVWISGEMKTAAWQLKLWMRKRNNKDQADLALRDCGSTRHRS